MSERNETSRSTDARDRPVSELGEHGLIDRISAALGPPRAGEIWGGDDAAVFHAPSETLVFTTDALVEGIDFDLSYSAGSDVGWKLVACNASDAAAMGAAPRYALVTLTLPPHTSIGFVDDLLNGILDASMRWGMQLVGGDISRGPLVTASLALLAAPFPSGVTLRSGAGAGDALCVTGSLGGAAAGMFVLQRGLVGLDVVRAEIDAPSGADGLAVLAAKHLRPAARVQEADRLGRTVGLTAAIDISDGLAADLGHLLRASRVGCLIDMDTIPVEREISFLSGGPHGAPDGLTFAVTGGEDFELLFTMDATKVTDAQLALDEVGVPVTQIGEITDGPALLGDRPLKEWEEAGWDHLRTR